MDTDNNKSDLVLSKEEVLAQNGLKTGQKIKVNIGGLETGATYDTYIRDVAEGSIYIDIPVHDNAYIVPAFKSKVTANFIFNNSVYMFEALLLSITKVDSNAVWIVEIPDEFKKVQRRHFLRMDVLLPVKVNVEAAGGVYLPPMKTYCLDISAGGVRYVIDFPINAGKIAKISVDEFPGIGQLEAFCEAVRSVKSVYSEENYWIGARFIDLPSKIEDEIVRYIFRVQKRVIISSSPE